MSAALGEAQGLAKIVCTGITVLDRVWDVPAIPPRPEKVTATGYRETGGGTAATACVAIAALGGRAALWSRVGDDAVGRALRDDLARRGVDVADLRLFPEGATPTTAALVDPAGERLLGVFTGRGLSDDAGWLPLRSLAGVDAVLADIRWPEGAAALFAAAGERRIRRVLDADVGAPAALPALARAADYVVFSTPALAAFSGTASPEAGLRRAARETGAVLGVTLGGDGCMWLDDGTARCAPALRVAARDTTGAGDVFHAAFTLALAEGRSVARAMAFANAAAGLKCETGNGWDGMPTRSQLERRCPEFVRTPGLAD